MLFVGVKDDKIVGYRTVLPDLLVKGNEKLKTELKVKRTDQIDPDTLEFRNRNNKALTRRSKNEFEWIINYPWIKQEKDSDPVNRKYHFSATAKSFSFLFYKIFNDNVEIVAFLIIWL